MTKAGPHVKKCKAKSKRTGDPCRSAALAGMEVCRMHGGATGHAKRKARERLEAAADRMAMQLLKMATDPNVADSVKLTAIRDSLDRAGLAAPKQTDVTVALKPYESLLDDLGVESGSRSDYRASIGRPDQPQAIEANHLRGGPPTEPSGVRIIGETSDGHAVIDGELADDDQDSRTYPAGERVPTDAHHVGRDKLANPVVPVSPVRGYLPGDLAMEQAAEANRNHRAQLRRR